ncbi:MAG: RDD family protein [Steroidobacteraceae bacterium]
MADDDPLARTGLRVMIESPTGVAVQLPIAGPGARAYAFFIDWMIRAAAAAAWYVCGAALYNRGAGIGPPSEISASWYAAVIAPATAIYFLYHFVLEPAMHGQTPGKRLAHVRIVDLHGARCGVNALLIRNVFRLIDSLPGVYGLGLATTLLTRQHVRLGDLAAGTVLVYDRPAETHASAGGLPR